MRFFRPQARRRSPAALLALILAAAAPARGADPPGGVEYDIVRADDSLAVWLNLTPFFGHPEYRSLQDGIDYACEIAIELQR
ncbi:MAG TPA: hypothetical protein PKY95_11815, partial [candidate division Zixibacteria bacterium]|nr:hypothetical protein [candidate division Zixibacteria bacterium]